MQIHTHIDMQVYICWEDVILNFSILSTDPFRPAQAFSLDSSGDILTQPRSIRTTPLPSAQLSSTVPYAEGKQKQNPRRDILGCKKNHSSQQSTFQGHSDSRLSCSIKSDNPILLFQTSLKTSVEPFGSEFCTVLALYTPLYTPGVLHTPGPTQLLASQVWRSALIPQVGKQHKLWDN